MKSQNSGELTRRTLFQVGAAAAAGLSATGKASAAALPTRGKGPNVYERIGVKPFINCTSSRTMNGGSAAVPEVAEAIYEASFYHVNLQELLGKACPYLAELMGVPAVAVASGAAGCLTSATLAAMAGGDPEALQQLPSTDGLKDEVVCIGWARSIYDHAIRMTGAKMIEVHTPEDLAQAFGPKTFLAFSGHESHYPGSKLPLAQFIEAAHAHGVPVLIDAAAELPLLPDPYMEAGADMVAYSGGKSLKGPQSGGLLLCSRPELARAAFIGAAPHHTYARPMKVSKEEVMGLIAAVEDLVRTRDVKAEYAEYTRWFEHIIARITQVDGVKAWVIPEPRPGYYPVMQVEWDQSKIGLVAREVGEQLLDGEPRIMTHAYPKELDPTSMETNNFLIRPMAMYADEYRIVAERLYQVLRDAPGPKAPPKLEKPAADLSGRWEVTVTYVAREATHTLYLDQDGTALRGLHKGRITEGDIQGTIAGSKVKFESRGKYEGADLRYYFEGELRGNTLSGRLGLGEYSEGTWSAKRA
ncbi:MAG: aminotransferase class V-fold PLP-dependent enzyme [Acidobacteria bacterium]|nr:aminotransferase class V-fold PLP-dependent enzyme [Acidobacteriota bacterium]